MRQMILSLILVALLGAIAIADDVQPASSSPPQAVEAQKKHDEAIKKASEAYHNAVIAADQQYIATLDAALKQAMTNQDIDTARAIDDEKKAAMAVLKKDQAEAVASQNPQLDHGLIAHYCFDGNANDTSGNGLDGTLQHSPSSIASPFGHAIHLVGQGALGMEGQYIKLPSVDFSTHPEFTISLLAHVDGDSSNGSGEDLISFGTWMDNVVAIAYRGPGVPGNYDLSFKVGTARVDAPMATWNQWRRYSIVYSKSLLTAYVDNQIVGTANGLLQSSAGNAGMGIHWWGGGVSTRFVGSLADVRIYDRALGADEIAQLAQPVR